ncbi:MAG: hypothetical protein PUE13_06460 [Clostridiales bacterium]|nr:hypothetical protein [Clostridiales bacterium]
MTVTNPDIEVVREEYSCPKELVSPAMTRFINSLGGRVVIVGETPENNYS